MKGISLNKQHLHQIAVRKLTVASCIGGLLTLLYGAWIVPWIAAVASWLAHQIPWWYQAGPFPNLLHFLASPNLKLGLIWLGYYLVTYIWAAVTPSSRQIMNIRTKAAREQGNNKEQDEWSFQSYSQPPQIKEEHPL